MTRIAYVNGAYRPQPHASVNIEDRGYQFADGIYEVVHIHRGRFTDWDLHFARLERSLREIRIPLPMSRGALEHVLAEVAARNRIDEGLLYMQVTRGVAPRNHIFPNPAPKPAIVVTAKRVGAYPASPDAWTTSVISHKDERWARCDIKSVGLLPNVLARQAAKDQGAAEAILVDRDGTVTEGAATSFWIVDRNGVLRCPPLSNAILPGCTRAALLEEMAKDGIAHDAEPFTLDDAVNAREAFITSATSFVKPVTALDHAPIADGQVGPVTRRLFALFARHVQGSQANTR